MDVVDRAHYFLRFTSRSLKGFRENLEFEADNKNTDDDDWPYTPMYVGLMDLSFDII
jgi:hypothetical protein